MFRLANLNLTLAATSPGSVESSSAQPIPLPFKQPLSAERQGILNLGQKKETR